jgi:adenylate cyclase
MSEFPAAYLEVEINGEVRQFPVTGDRILRIGRSSKNDVVLNEDPVSRTHAMLQCSDRGLCYITDCGSRNGTLVNGTRLTAPMALRPGDQIRIGNYQFTFHQEAAAEHSSVESVEKQPSTNVVFALSLITVLVVDIRDFTGLAQRVEASKLSEVTGTLFREAGQALQERGAWAQKYIGDAVMALWLHKKSAPEPTELAAIFDGLSCLTQIASGLQQQFHLGTPIRIGAGINSGWASVGNVGSIASADYTALGDVVNMTFRLESATKEMACDLALGQGAYEFLASFMDARHLFQKRVVNLKGYAEPATVYGAQLPSLPAVLEALQRAVNPL